MEQISRGEAILLGVNVEKAGVYLCADGRLIHHKIVIDLDKNFHSYFIDVTNDAAKYALMTVDFGYDLRMKDIFKFVHKNINVFEPIIGNWCREISQMAVNVSPSKTTTGVCQYKFEKFIDIEKKENAINVLGLNKVYFSAWGRFAVNGVYDMKDAPTPIGFPKIPLEEMLEIPVVLVDNALVYNSGDLVSKWGGTEYKLIELINEIFYEMTKEDGFEHIEKTKDLEELRVIMNAKKAVSHIMKELIKKNDAN